MTERRRLEAELFTARQELARERIERAGAVPERTGRLAYVPDRGDAFLGLAALSVDNLDSLPGQSRES